MDTVEPALLRLSAVAQLVGLSERYIRTAVAVGTFPRPVKIGARAIAWRRSEIETWIAALPAVVPSKKESEA